MKVGGLIAWLFTELAIFSIAIFALRNPSQTGTFIGTTATSVAGITNVFEGKTTGN